MSWPEILAEVIGAFLSGTLTFRVGSYLVTVKGVSGAPARFTFAAAIAAAESIFVGQPGSLQVGDVAVTVAAAEAVATNATPASIALAATIAQAVSVGPGAAAVAPAAEPGQITTEPTLTGGHSTP